MNKYRPGGRCGGDSAKQTSNPEFNASLASLLQQRERQDALFAPASAQASAPTGAAHGPAKPQQKTANQLVITETHPKQSKEAYIQLLLEGDYEE